MKKSRERSRKGCNIRFILEGRIQLLVRRNAVSVAVVTIGNNLFLLFSFPVPSELYLFALFLPPPLVNGRSRMEKKISMFPHLKTDRGQKKNSSVH